MTASEDEIMEILKKAILIFTDLGYIADKNRSTGIKKGEILVYYPDEHNRPLKIQIEYELDLETGEVTFTYP